MLSKKRALIYLVISACSSVLVILHARYSERGYLCEEWCSYIDYNAFLGSIFDFLLFLSSVFLIRLIATDTAFSAWKKFAKYFGAVVVVLAVFGVYEDQGSQWAVGGDIIPLIPLTIFLYIVGSIIIIRRYRKAKE